MSNVKTNDISFLDSLFTQKDFYFLNSLDEEIDLIEKQIKKQEKTRDFVVDAINSFENNLKTIDKNNISPVSNLLEELEQSFVLVNSNIKSLYSLKQNLTNINSDIVNLLVTIESHPTNEQLYMPQVDSLKSEIANYSNSCNPTKAEIANNDLTLNSFLSSSRFQKILDKKFEIPTKEEPTFNVRSNVNIKDNKKISDSNSKIYNNNVLRISEKENTVYLPYTNKEINSYLTQFSEDYRSPKEVISKEFVFPLDYYLKHPVLSRFRESYSLIRDREAKSIIEAIKYSMNLMFTYSLNPTIIAACKTQEQLENYLDCLENNQLDNFKDFEIRFEMNPI